MIFTKIMRKLASRSAVALAALTLGAALAVGCGAEKASEKPLTMDERVEQVVSSMSYKEKIGQMLMIGIKGTELNDDSRYMLTQYHAGGIILFDRNLADGAQTKKLIADLQSASDEKVPLFIAIDEEGGRVVRGAGFIEPEASQRDIGATGDVTRAEGAARRTGERLRELGFNVNLAPVADVSADDRSFSADSGAVIDFLRAATQGYESTHIMYALKHFPGIGRGTVDSHEDVSRIEASREELAADLAPFRTIIDEREPESYMVLVSHLIYPVYDSEHPASLSHAVQTDLLRGELGYRGIIITDDIEMGALARHYTPRELGVQAVLAGADIVLVCHEYATETEAYLGLLDAYENGTISEERLNESVRRIVRAKLLRGTIE